MVPQGSIPPPPVPSTDISRPTGTQKCPHCDKEILAAAKKCKHCGEWLESSFATENSKPAIEAVKKKSALKIVFGSILAIAAIIFTAIVIINITKSSDKDDAQLRKEIVGAYSYVETDDSDEDVTITIDGTNVFKENGVCEETGTMIVTVFDEDGDKSTVKYKIEVFAKYEIKNSYIIYDFRMENIGITQIQSDNRELSKYLKDHYIPQMKHEMVTGDNKEKIIELNEKFLKTKDADGDISTYVRLSNKTTDGGHASGNLITPTSIAGVEVIGKTQKEIKTIFDKGFRWDFYDYGYDGTGWSVYKGETVIFSVNVDVEDFDVKFEDRKIHSAVISASSYSTTDGLRVGSTSGDILKKYPKAKIDEWAYSDHGIQYTTINDIRYYFDYECKVANQTGLIVNKTCRIESIGISGHN
jgi:thiol-disulfide isomerase/thioredoxin